MTKATTEKTIFSGRQDSRPIVGQEPSNRRNHWILGKKTIFSGIQPTGALHIGNLIGAIDLWVQTQKSFGQVIFCVVDMHSITVNPVQSKLDSLYTAKYYIACGIDPNIANIFLQSSVKEHAELCWILSCITPVGWLNRMTQFKEKSSSNKENSSLGLYSYPV